MVESGGGLTLDAKSWNAAMAASTAFWRMADGFRVDFRTLFTEGAVIDLGARRFTGVEDIQSYIETKNRTGGNAHSRHSCTNQRLERTGNNEIALTAIVSVYAGKGELPVHASSPYLISDVSGRFHRTDDAWRIAHISIIPVFVA